MLWSCCRGCSWRLSLVPLIRNSLWTLACGQQLVVQDFGVTLGIRKLSRGGMGGVRVRNYALFRHRPNIVLSAEMLESG